MARRTLRTEVAALRRANESLRRELAVRGYAGATLRHDRLKTRASRAAPAEPSRIDACINAECEPRPVAPDTEPAWLRRVKTHSDDGTQSVGRPSGSAARLSGFAERVEPLGHNQTSVEGGPSVVRDREERELDRASLGARLDSIEREIRDLRQELATAARQPPDSQAGDLNYRLLFRPLEAHDREIIIDEAIDVSPRVLRRPWFYVPFLVGIGLLALILALLLLLGGS